MEQGVANAYAESVNRMEVDDSRRSSQDDVMMTVDNVPVNGNEAAADLTKQHRDSSETATTTEEILLEADGWKIC